MRALLIRFVKVCSHDHGTDNTKLPASSGFAAVFETGGTSVLQLHLKLRPNDDLTALAILKSATRFFRFTAGANPRSGPLLFRRDSYTYTRNPFAWPGRQMRVLDQMLRLLDCYG